MLLGLVPCSITVISYVTTKYASVVPLPARLTYEDTTQRFMQPTSQTSGVTFQLADAASAEGERLFTGQTN